MYCIIIGINIEFTVEHILGQTFIGEGQQKRRGRFISDRYWDGTILPNVIKSSASPSMFENGWRFGNVEQQMSTMSLDNNESYTLKYAFWREIYRLNLQKII